MGEDTLARLAVVRAAATQVAADRHAHHDRARPLIARAVAQHRHLVANLHHRGPDVVEELNFDYRLDSAHRHADGAADDAGFGNRRVEHAVAAVGALQAMRDLEDAAFALHFLQGFGAARVRDVLAEHDDARVARHLVLQRLVDRVHHRRGLAVRSGRRVERRRCRIDVRRVDEVGDGVLRRFRRRHRLLGGERHLAVELGFEGGQVGGSRQAVRGDEGGQAADRVALRFRLAFSRRLVQLVVVGQRVRVRADDVRVHQRGPLAGTHVVCGRAHGAQAVEQVGAVGRFDVQARERAQQLRDVAARHLNFDRRRDGVAVVFDEEQDRNVARARHADGFPEFAFAGRPFAKRGVDDFIRVEERLAVRDLLDPAVERARFGHADGVQHLRGRAAGTGDDVQRLVAPVRRHLATGVARVGIRADRRQQHVERRDAELQAEGPIAVIGVEPVVTWAQRHADGDENGLVAGAADLEERVALVLELDFLVVDFSRQDDGAIGVEDLVAGEPIECGLCNLRCLTITARDGALHRFRSI